MRPWSLLRTLAIAAGLAALAIVPAGAAPASDAVSEYDAAIAAWQVERAAAAVAAMPESVGRRARDGIVAYYAADYARAESTLATVVADETLAADPRLHAEAQQHLALARGALRIFADAVVEPSPDGQVVAVFAAKQDALLAPYLFDALARARVALEREIGVVPSEPVRVEVLASPADLAAVTPLSLEAIRTTGTVAVTKYRRIVMITPRVMVYGYGWLDTVVHEYAHYVVTQRALNRAPVWLQEGLAKLLETRWRLDAWPRLEGGPAGLLRRALKRDELVSFEQMHPSLAMLPSQEMATLAYAQLESMLAFFRERRGRDGVDALLGAVAAGIDAREALARAWGADFGDFERAWRKAAPSHAAGTTDGPLRQIEFVDPDEDAPADPDLLGDVFSELGGGRARQHARLGVMLTVRGHKLAAVQQYEKARRSDARAARDPKLAQRLGGLYVEAGRHAEAVPLLHLAAAAEPENADLAAAEGRALLRTGRLDEARAALGRAVRNNPFIPTLHCDLAELATDEVERERERRACPE